MIYVRNNYNYKTKKSYGKSVLKMSPKKVAYGGISKSQHRGCMWMIQTFSCDLHFLIWCYTKNHTFSIYFDHILDKYQINSSSITKQIKPIVDNEVSKLYDLLSVFYISRYYQLWDWNNTVRPTFLLVLNWYRAIYDISVTWWYIA